MLVVHGLWHRGHLALWAEDPAAPAAPPRRSGRAPKERPHPFAAPAGDLAAALGEIAAKATQTTAVLGLPTAGGRPVDSPELVPPGPPGPPPLAPATPRAPP
ncbi:hypothetical protein K1W54_35625, partial [Micromonospora sp. CPCC 205371]|nr:hypothetical protein [Micromonospora sp. CPCC 205371]